MSACPNDFARSAAALFAISLALAACQSEAPKPPAPQPVITATVPHIRLTVADRTDITYLARTLMPGRYQTATAIYSEAQNDDPNRISPAFTNTVGVAAAGAMGQSPLSPSGSATAAYGAEAASVLQGIAGGKSASVQSGRAYLPDSVNGFELTSQGQARELVRDEVRKRVEEFAQLAGRTVTCFDQCESFFPTYKLTKGAGPEWLYYDPPSLYVTFYLRKPLDRRKRTDSVLEKILGKPVAWEEVCYISLTADVPTGDHKTVDGESVPEFQDRSTFSSPLERTLLRVLTKGGIFTWGAQNWRQFAWNGRVFALGEKAEPASLIQYEIAPETDQMGRSAK